LTLWAKEGSRLRIALGSTDCSVVGTKDWLTVGFVDGTAEGSVVWAVIALGLVEYASVGTKEWLAFGFVEGSVDGLML
jgi:hypothetical protein